jgi:hypothetical protein
MDKSGELTRRSVLTGAVGLSVATALAGSAISATPASAWSPNTQSPWTCCIKCFDMFYLGFRDNGQCPRDGLVHDHHLSWIFKLPYNSAWTPNDQPDWRWCGNCHALFFAGYAPNLGRCTFGGPHRIDGSGQGQVNFVLPHDIGEPPGTQAAWRFCVRCYALYFDGWQTNKGICPAGSGHAAAGYNFAIPVDSYTPRP